MKIQLLLITIASLLMNTPTECSQRKIFQYASINIIIELSNILKHKIHAIVNTADQSLTIKAQELSETIAHAAGFEQLQEACYQFPEKNGIRCPIGQACITDSFNLKNIGIKYIIHAVVPTTKTTADRTQLDTLLANCYANCLQLAQNYNAQSIAFPFMGSNIYTASKKQIATIAIKTVCQYLKQHPETTLQKVHFMLISQEDFDLFCNITQKITTNSKDVEPSKDTATIQQISVWQKIIQTFKDYFN